MTISLKHKFESTVPDQPKPGLVRPSNWNDEHDLKMSGSRILGRKDGDVGNAQELTGADVAEMLDGQFATTAQGEKADTAVQPEDTIAPGKVAPSSLDSSKAAEFRSVIKVSDTYVNVKDHFGVKGGNDAGDWAKIQAALDAEPKGNILYFPADSYVGTVPLVMSKHKSLKLDPNAVLTLSSAVSSDDLLRIAITNPASSDVRNMIIEGGTWIADSRANCAININPSNSTPDQNPHFETHIRNAMITGGLYAIRIGGATPAGDSNFNTIEGNNLAIQRSGGICVNLDGCADGHRILNNLMFGPGTAIRLNLVLGAYKTLISGNCLVTRDGALLVTNGSNWSFENNQVEQHGGTNLLGQHIQVQGLSYPAKHWRIVANNFGGGSDVNYSIWLINSIAGLIDENQMQLCAVADVGLIDGGDGYAPRYNTIGARNTFRGARSIRSDQTDASRRMILDVSPGINKDKGIWRSASGLTYSNSWAQSNLRRMVDEHGILHWEGALSGGTTSADTVILAAGQLPACERPINTTVRAPVGTASGVGQIEFGTDGGLIVRSLPAASPVLSGVSYPVNWWDTYEATP